MRRQHAFTLIELLVVIAIIVLLVSILMPSLQKAKDMAKDVVCANNQKTVSQAIFLYVQDYEDMLPYNRMSYPSPPWLTWRKRVGRIAKAAQGGWTAYSATDRRIIAGGYIDMNYYSNTEGPFKCPIALDRIVGRNNWWPWHFSISSVLSEQFSNEQIEAGKVFCVRFGDLRDSVVLIGDCGLKPAGGWQAKPFYTHEYRGYTEWALLSGGPWPYLSHIGTFASNPTPVDFEGHTGDKSNLAFTDGHVEATRDLKLGDFNPDRVRRK